MAALWLYLSVVICRLCLLVAAGSQAGVQQSVFRDPGLGDVVPNTDSVLFQTTARSRLDCARRCSGADGGCQSFTHFRGSSGSWSCRGHSVLLTSAGDTATAAPGARTYVMSVIQEAGSSAQVTLDPCVHHTVIDDPRRERNVILILGDPGLGDHDLAPGWYRFQVSGNNAVISISSSPKFGCSTTCGIWLDMTRGGLPLAAGDETQAVACSCLGAGVPCSKSQIPVTVRHCGDFIVYDLKPVNHTYCVEADD